LPEIAIQMAEVATEEPIIEMNYEIEGDDVRDFIRESILNNDINDVRPALNDRKNPTL